MEQFAPSWWGEQHDWQWPGAASCPFSATFVATDHRAVSLLQLAVQKTVSVTRDNDLSVVLASFRLSWF